jgi:hypothetical protein
MALPGFSAESSLGPALASYRGSASHGRSGDSRVSPALDTICGGCGTVGGLGGISGVGRRSCCRKVWKWNPTTGRLEQTWSCWFESCSPSLLTL